jgi:hypothetical protein
MALARSLRYAIAPDMIVCKYDEGEGKWGKDLEAFI